MNELLKKLLFSALRKVIFGIGTVWVAWLVERGICTEADISRFIEVIVAGLMLIVPVLWTFIKGLLEKRQAEKADTKQG